MTTKEIMKGAKAIDIDELLEAVQESMFGMENRGFCLACGEEAYNVEPDAREYPCSSCNNRAVFGASEILLYVA